MREHTGLSRRLRLIAAAHIERTPGGLEGERAAEERMPERAIASQGWGEQRELKVVDDDRPLASPDIASAHEDGDKPR